MLTAGIHFMAGAPRVQDAWLAIRERVERVLDK
jgi:hypothetical protein